MKNISKALASAFMTVALLGGNFVCADVIDRDETTTTVTETSEAAESDTSASNNGGGLALDGVTFETMYGSQLGVYLNHQYYYDLKEIPIAESNFYFIHSFTDMSQRALQGSYPVTSEGFIDLAYDLPNAEAEGFGYPYLGEYFKEFSENQLLSTYIVLDMAKEAGTVLSDEYSGMIDEYMVTLEGIAAENNLTLDEYLKIFYGDDCDSETFRGILDRYYLSSQYSEDYVTNYEFSDDELYVPSVCHALFSPANTSADADAAAKQEAENFKASCKSVNDIMTLGTEMAANGECRECAEYSVSKGRFVSEFEDWAYDADRKEGDIGIVKTSYGYHVMGYYGVEEIGEADKQEIALKALNDEVGSIAMSDVHEFYTNDTIDKPAQVAAPESSDTEATTASETAISLPLDEEGNISLETTAGEEAQITAEPLKTPKSLSITRKVTIGLAVAVIVAIIVVAVVMVAKSRKQQEQIIKAAGKHKSPDDDTDEDEE